ncbi:MAG: hypothetical protein N3A66_07110, partial [Planctomycetota bacterium]|nr:hypothetical protein [Planctomycetota bacterium]
MGAPPKIFITRVTIFKTRRKSRKKSQFFSGCQLFPASSFILRKAFSSLELKSPPAINILSI